MKRYLVPTVILAALFGAPASSHATTPFDHELVAATGLTGYSSSLAIDAQGNPHVAFSEFPPLGSPVLRYASKVGDTWTVEPIVMGSPSGFGQVSLALDPNGVPWIAYYDAGFQALLYATKDGNSWQANYVVDFGADVGSYNSIAIDRQGTPHVAYYDATNGDLKYASHIGGWATEVVFSSGVGGQHCSLTFDSENSPHVSFYDASNGWLRYAYKGGGGWIIDVADGGPVVGRFTSIALDSQNHPHIAYIDDFNSIVKYASKQTTWSTENVQFASSRQVSLEIDAQDVPHVAYETSALWHASKTFGVWSFELVDAVNLNANHASLALDTEGNPLIAYQDASNADLIVASSAVRLLSPNGGNHWPAGGQQTVRWSGAGPVDILLSQDGGASYTTARSSVTGGTAVVGVPAWTTSAARVKVVRNSPRSTSESPGTFSIAPDILPLFWTRTVDATNDVGNYNSITLDSQGNPHVSYTENPSGRMKYARRVGQTWTSEYADTNANHYGVNSIQVDALGTPRIAYQSFSDGHLRYARRAGSIWTVEEADPSVSGFGGAASLALDALGNPRIAYRGSGLQYASKSGGLWTLEVVDGGLVDGFTSLALDTAGTPYISYYLGLFGGSDLKFATKSGSIWNTEYVDTDGDVGASNSIALDAGGTPHIAYFDQTNWNLKYATRSGGAGWILETVDALGTVGNLPSLRIDAQGVPHITYGTITNNSSEIRHASKIGGTWVIEKVDAGAYLTASSLALDAQGLPRVSYYDGIAGDLKYAAETPEISSPAAGATWPVGSQRTVTWNGTGRVSLSISVDGGASYAPVATGLIGGSHTLTVPHTPTKFAKVRLERAVPVANVATDSFFTIQTSVSLLALLAAPAPNRDPGAIVSWNTDPGPEDLAGYRLDRAAGSSDWVTVVPLTRETSYADPTAAPATRYRLFAVNGLGEELMLGETSFRPLAPLAAWPLPYRGGNLSISFATGSGLGGGAAPARVRLFDASGRLVRTLVEGAYPAGYNAAVWDGRDGNGRKVASGVYFLRSENAGERRDIKIAVLR